MSVDDDAQIVNMLAWLHARPGSSVARTCKHLGLSASELWRLLAAIDGAVDDRLGLVDVIDREGHPCLRLSARGEQLFRGDVWRCLPACVAPPCTAGAAAGQRDTSR